MLRSTAFVRVLTTASIAVFLAGCATNAIRIDRAKSMVAAGRAAGDATTGLMEKTRLTNREVLIGVASIDPNCKVAGPRIAVGEAPAGTIFCLKSGPGGYTLQRVTKRDFVATMAVIKTLAGYLDLVEGVVTREPVDIAADLAAARSDLKTIVSAANAVSGNDLNIPALSSEQSSAIDSALKILSEIADDQGKVDDLRAIETVEQQQAFSETVAKLRIANRQWVNRLDGQLDNQLAVLETRLRRMRSATEAQRRPVVEQQLALIEQADGLAQMHASLESVLDQLDRAHLSYRILLFDRNAKLTDAEKAKAAKINHDRVMGALQALTSIILAF